MFKNEEGFSLLELVVAVGVAGIIAAVALPTFAGIQDKATTTSATYAASASAAEALANSTMGTTGGTTSGSSSTTSTNSVTVSGSDFRNGELSWASNLTVTNGGYYAPYTQYSAGDAIVDYWTTFNSQEYVSAGQVVLAGLTEAKMNDIITAVNNGATTVTVDATTYTLSSGWYDEWTTNGQFLRYGKILHKGSDWYGGYQVRLSVAESLAYTNYGNAPTVTVTIQ